MKNTLRVTDAEYLDNLAEEAVPAHFKRFIGLSNPTELADLLISADNSGKSWPSPSWLRKYSPEAMKNVQDGWVTWDSPAPKGALVLRSEEEQRLYCGDRWFLFPDRKG